MSAWLSSAILSLAVTCVVTQCLAMPCNAAPWAAMQWAAMQDRKSLVDGKNLSKGGRDLKKKMLYSKTCQNQKPKILN